MNALKTYFIAVLWNIVSLVAGVFSVLFIIICIVFNFDAVYHPTYWGIIFAVSYIVSSYTVWYNARPCTRIRVDAIEIISDKDLRLIFTLTIGIKNTKPERNTISEWSFGVRLSDSYQAAEFLNGFVFTNRGGSAPRELIIEQNIPQTINLSFAYPAEVLFTEGLTYLNVPYEFSCVDVYGQKYVLKGNTPANNQKIEPKPPLVSFGRSLTKDNPFKGYKP